MGVSGTTVEWKFWESGEWREWEWESGRESACVRVCVFGGFSLCYAGLLALIMSQKYNVIYC